MDEPTDYAACSIDDCDYPVAARGWCYKHYQRWRRHGDPHATLRTHTPGITHGLLGTYHHGCRCPQCTEAHRLAGIRHRARRRTLTPRRHGASTYTNWGCRCPICVDAHAARLRAQRAAKKQR